MKALMKDEFNEQYSLRVIDVMEKPDLALDDEILATPTLIKVAPGPIRRLIGDVRDKKKVLSGLGLVDGD